MADEWIIDLPDVSLFVRSTGDPAAPVLLALHGGPGWDHSYLLPALGDLADVRRVVLVDLRGCGRSSRDLPPEHHQPELCVEDTARLVGVLGVDRVDLLGFSYGGQLAMLFAERHPGLLDRLVLASTTAYPDFAEHLARNQDYRRRSPAVGAAVAAILTSPRTTTRRPAGWRSPRLRWTSRTSACSMPGARCSPGCGSPARGTRTGWPGG